jgi:capsular exopolysaccharide synthesis family protein
MDQEKLLMMTDVREVWLFAKRNVKLVLGIVVAVTVITMVVALVLPPRYMGEAVVMLDPRRTHIANIEQVISNLPTDNQAIRSEIDIIESRSVINRVIKELGLQNDREFNPSLSVLGWFERLFASRKPEDRAQQESADRNVIADRLLKKLDVKNDGRSYTISIGYSNRNPAKAAKIANAFADQYLVDQLEVKYETTQRANIWLNKRMEALRDEVATAEKAVEDFKISHNLTAVGEETLTERQLGTINSQLLEARAERSQAEARLTSVKDLPEEKMVTSSAVLSSQLISQLNQQEAEVQRKVGDLATRYGDRHPKMIDARNELLSIRDKIKEEVSKVISGFQNDYAMADAKVTSLEKDLAKLSADTGSGNKDMVMLRQLQREASASRSLYEGFLNRSKQVAEQQDMQTSDSRIIAHAEIPLKAYFPNLWIFLGLGVALGLVAGFMVALLIEYLDRGIRTLGFIEKNYDVPGLGIMPLAEIAEGQLPSDYVLEKPLSAYAESLRSIRTAIHFSNVDNPPKVIVTTSTLPGEGKTVFCTSLARVLAKSGNKVLLIDGDMRRPRMHSLLNLDKTKPDLALLLAGEATLQQAIQKDASGADVIISRTKTPNPQDLISSKQMEKLVMTARELYDVVIIDTPPIMAMTDAALIARLADSVVYVVRWASTPRDVVGEGLKQFNNFGIKLTGAVLTQVDLQQHKQYGYGDYGYYYGHYKNYYSN